MSISLLMLPLNIKGFDKLPEEIKRDLIAYAEFCNEKGIIPLLESNVVDFETRFAQAGKYLYNYILQAGMLIISRYPKEREEIMSNLVGSMRHGLDEVRKEFSTFGDKGVVLLKLDAIDVIDNFMSSALDPDYYMMAFETYINVSVCMSAYWAVKSNEKLSTDRINDSLIQKSEENIDILNELIKTIEVQEDKKAIVEGRREYAEGKAKHIPSALLSFCSESCKLF